MTTAARSRHDRREAGRERHHETGEPAWEAGDRIEDPPGLGRQEPRRRARDPRRRLTASIRPGSATVTRPAGRDSPDQVGRRRPSTRSVQRPAVDRDRVVAVGRQRDRQGERRGAPRRRPASPTTPGDRHRPAEKAAPRSARSPAAIALADRRAADVLAVERERRDDDDVEAVARAELRERGRRPATLEAERRVRRHQEAAAARPARGSARRTRRTASAAAPRRSAGRR